MNGRPFLSCATTVFYLHGRRLRAARLLDARHPRRQAAPLPGMRNLKRGGEVVAAAGSVSARRAGPGGIAAFGGTTALRTTLLRALRTGS